MLSKALPYLARHGFSNTLRYVIARSKFIVSPPETAGEVRVRLSLALSEKLNNTVAAGLFAGMVLLPASTWGRGDRGSQLLGLYEQEIQDLIKTSSAACDCLIDVGAADGYYAVFSIFKNLFQSCYAFEASDESRHSIAQLAVLNGIIDKIVIHGFCSSEQLLVLPLSCRQRSFMLVDIEGGEFDLLSTEVISAFSKSIFAIELHPWAVPAGEQAVADLCNRFSRSHNIMKIGQGARDPNQFEFLRQLPDNERWLLASENRGQWMEWLIAQPR
jgi:hypothetical protein